MDDYTAKQKLLLLDITDEVVVDIISNQKDPFGIIQLMQVHIDKSIPSEKMIRFITILTGLEYKGFIKRGLQPDGRMWSVTNKWKWKKFYNFIGWKYLAWWLLFLLACYTAYLQFIALPNSEAKMQVEKFQELPNPTPQQSFDTSLYQKKKKIDSPITKVFVDSAAKAKK